jgi:hypothetical protein
MVLQVNIMNQYQWSLVFRIFSIMLQALQKNSTVPLLDQHIKYQMLLTFAIIYDYKISRNLLAIGEKQGYWVKLKSTTWFTHFLLIKYNDYMCI